MGRKTFESFPKPYQIELTSPEKKNTAEGCIIVDSIDQALAVCPKDQDTYIRKFYTLGLPC
jgi:dihydrofolate reductase